MMKIYQFILFALLLTACKTMAPVVTPSVIIRDSVSVTYRQGEVISLAEPAELAEPESAASQALSSPKAQHNGLAPQAKGCYSPQAPTNSQKVRVDTVVIERWHTKNGTEVVREKYTPPFYKRCTWGFWVLLLILLGSIAIRILRLIYFRR